MKHLFETDTVAEVRERLSQLTPDSERLWGRMTVAQALAHCSASMEHALGLTVPAPRRLIGRLVGPLAKKWMLYDGKPIRRNSPTDKRLLVTDERDFEAERQRLVELIDRFAAGGPERCTTHPHSFLGRLTPVEWASMMYHHLAHHLRQFGV